MTRIEIVHHRDPDCECSIEVFVDGVRVTDVDIEDVDPGRGYERDDWNESTEFALSRPERSDAFKDAIREARELAGESKFIEDPSDGWAMRGRTTGDPNERHARQHIDEN